MAKFSGKIGYADTVETEPGIWEEQVIERTYTGDFIRNTRKLQTSGSINDNINIANEVSIISDPFAEKNFFKIRYIEYMGAKWKITAVEPRYPRLILTIGGLYNGE